MLSPYVVDLETLKPYKLRVCFDDGTVGIVDLSDSAALGGVFSVWSDEEYWHTAHIVAETGAVAWGDGRDIDVCPVSLYLDATGRTFDELQAEPASVSVA